MHLSSPTATRSADSFGQEQRLFERTDVTAAGLEVTVGELGKPPTESRLLNISRGGLQLRTGVGFFEGSEGTECVIRFRDANGRLTPTQTLACVRHVEESAGYFLVAVEFTQPLDHAAPGTPLAMGVV